MPPTIKREIFRHKYYMVHRDNGKVVEKIRWSPRGIDKTINKRMAVDNFKNNNSIYNDRKRFTGNTWKVIEESRLKPTNYEKLKEKRPSIRKRRNIDYQYVIEGVIFRKDGTYKRVIASSRSHEHDYPVDNARDEAIQSFMERADFIYHGEKEGHYDANEGVKLLEKGKVEIKKEGVKHYIEKA